MPTNGEAPAAETAAPAGPSLLAWGACPALYVSYGLSAIKGRQPELMGALAAVPSFTVLSPPMGIDYFGVFDGHSGAEVANYLTERLHGAMSDQILRELLAEAPRFLHGSQGDVEGWWRAVMADAFQRVDAEVLQGLGGVDAAVAGATALVALVLEQYVVLANCGVSRAVISRGGEILQLTAEHRPNRPDEKQRVENGGGRVDESTNTVDEVLPTSRAFGSYLYKRYLIAEPEITAVARDPRDEFLILATAGLWDSVSPVEACRVVERKLRSRSRSAMAWGAATDSRASATMLAKELAQHAVRAGSTGNVSVIVVLFRDDPAVVATASPAPVLASGRVQRPRRGCLSCGSP
ncbi:hypothetical protein ZWY2020_033197 [Hordeum vulgare]|nr:hypothetical protein ZWY2020_033197 [Hordeum vulgare]